MADQQTNGLEVLETREWLDSLDYVLSQGGPDRAGRLLQQLALHARRAGGVNLPFTATTPYQNTIYSKAQAPFPGSQEMERRIKSLVRWNALAMKVTLIDPEANPGGVCLYRGCIPSKSLLHIAKLIEEAEQSKAWGIEFPKPKINLDQLRSFKESVVKKLTGGLGQLAKQRSVQYVQGKAAFVNSTTLKVTKTAGGEENMHSSDSAPPVSSQSVPSGVSSRAVTLKADSPSAVQSAGFAVAPARVATPETSLKPVASVPSTPVKKSAPKADSDDPMLADLDDLENPGGFSPPPFTQLKLKRRTPIVAFTCVMIMLAGAGTYFAWMTRPDFRDFVMYEYVKVRALIGKPVPPPPAPVQSKPAPPPTAPVTTPATPEESAPGSSTSTTDGATPIAASPEVTPVVAPAPNSTQPRTAPANRQR